MYKLFLTLRYLRKRKIVFIAIGAVTLCVAMVLVVLSVMGGWLDMVKNRARGLLGDVVIENKRYSGMPLYDDFLRTLAARGEPWMNQVERAAPVIYTYGLIRFPDTAQNDMVRVVGIRLEDTYAINGFKDGLFYERYFPGTTSFEEQKQPVVGRDMEAEPRPSKDGEHFVVPMILPKEYQAALEHARAEHLERTGKPLDDTDTYPTRNNLNNILREEGLPTIPGVWEIDPSGDFSPQFIDNPAPGLIIGRDIAADRQSDGRYLRGYAKGSLVFVTLSAVSITGKIDPQPISQAFRYVDDSRTGIYEIDSRHVYCDFDLIQKLIQMGQAERVDPLDPEKVIGKVPARCSQIQIKLAPGADADDICVKLTDLYRRIGNARSGDLDSDEVRLVGNVEAQTWQQTQAHIIVPVEKEKMLVTILFGIISLVAVVLILCILYMIVLQKTKDIGILKAIGASSGGAAAIWVMYGLSVGIVGGLLGGTLGSVFVHYINDFQDLLIKWFNFRVWDLKVYSFDTIPNHVAPRDLIMVVLVAILASTVGSVAAAWRAGTMEPVESIRYE